MCGVAGVIGAGGPDDLRLAEAMGAALSHRGPDGLRVERLQGAILAHARLSIIDLEGGWQPLHAAGSTVIGNGEIYNYKELAAAHGLGDRLRTGSDFEPLLHLYAQEGERAFERLRGMYAFCLLGSDGRIWLVRDRFGIKPLHILEDGDRLLFASEPQAILKALGRRATLSLDQRRDLLAFNFLLPGEDEIFEGRALRPGEAAEATGGRLRGGVPAPRPGARPSAASDPDAALRGLDTVLEDSVRLHQRSDVPYGLFLSGGLDSTAIAVLMARLNTRPVTAFTCGFPGGEAPDERPKAEAVARALGLDWREIPFDLEDFWALAPEAAAALDQPTADYATLPTLKLAKAARRELRVVLTGEGGDEIFAGYGRYRRALRPRLLGGRPAEPQIAASTGSLGRPPDAPTALARWRRATAAARAGARGPLAKAQAADLAAWLPNDLLLKLDRCLMAEGLEGRTPFLDPQVAAFAEALPLRLKVRGRYGKWLLRRWLQHSCPESEPWARKRGFTVPVAAFTRTRAADLGRAAATSPALVELFRPGEVEALFSDEHEADRRWPILFLVLWYAIHVEGASPEEARRRYLAVE